MKLFQVSTKLTLASWILSIAAGDKQCPGSPAWKHAKCLMKVHFPSTSCETVQEEIKRRISAQDNGWFDPHNRGVYNLIDGEQDQDNHLSVSRLTGDKKYTDLMDFSFSQEGQDCELTACSESQVFSILDFSTNYCNLHNLYCSSKEGCPVLEHDFDYEETYENCSQRDVQKCLSSLDTV